MKKHFEKQLKTYKVITEESLQQLNGKSIYGEYQVGDQILWFMEASGNFDECEVNLVVKTITEREFERFEKEYNYLGKRDILPIFVRKGK